MTAGTLHIRERPGGMDIHIECPHIDGGSCAACLAPTMEAWTNAAISFRDERNAARREAERVKGRLARVLRVTRGIRAWTGKHGLTISEVRDGAPRPGVWSSRRKERGT